MYIEKMADGYRTMSGTNPNENVSSPLEKGDYPELNDSNLQLLLCLMVFYIVLGCFLDGISSIVLTMAVVEPMIRDAGINVIWFGIYLTVLVEMAQITPPVGFNLFVLQGMTKHEMYFLAKSALPMFLVMVVMVFIMIAFPELATYLPSTVRSAGAG